MTEQFINFIIENSKKESDFDSLKKGLEQNSEKLQKNSNALIGAYMKGFLDSKKHSLGIVYLLNAKASTGADKNFISACETFFSQLDQYQTSKASSKCKIKKKLKFQLLK
jgi:hypothetical protein